MILDVVAIQQHKADLRARAESARRQLPDRLALSRRITARLAALPEYHTAGTVMFYVNLPHEADTQHFLPAAWAAGKQVAVPYMADGKIRLFRLDSLDELASGHFHVPEPRPELRREPQRSVEPGSIDLVVVPGVAFDRRGGRIGHGKGYYDLFLKQVSPQAPRIALAFECQLLDDLPMLPHDVWINKIVTEAAVYDAAPKTLTAVR